MRGDLGGLPESLAEVLYPLLRSLPRHAYLRLFDAFFAVGTVPEVPELLAGLGFEDGSHRLFYGFPAPIRPGPRLARQDLVGHLQDCLFRLRKAFSSLGMLQEPPSASRPTP